MPQELEKYLDSIPGEQEQKEVDKRMFPTKRWRQEEGNWNVVQKRKKQMAIYRDFGVGPNADLLLGRLKLI